MIEAIIIIAALCVAGSFAVLAWRAYKAARHIFDHWPNDGWDRDQRD